jgi:hypothetical protein
MSFHSNTWSWDNQSLLFLLKDAWLAEKQQIPILHSLVWPDRNSNTLWASTQTITPLIWSRLTIFFFWDKKCTSETRVFLVMTNQNVILQGHLVNSAETYFLFVSKRSIKFNKFFESHKIMEQNKLINGLKTNMQWLREKQQFLLIDCELERNKALNYSKRHTL